MALLNTLRRYRKTARARESFRRAVVKILERKRRASIERVRARVEEIDKRNAFVINAPHEEIKVEEEAPEPMRWGMDGGSFGGVGAFGGTASVPAVS